MGFNPLQKELQGESPLKPKILTDVSHVAFAKEKPSGAAGENIAKLFPHTCDFTVMRGQQANGSRSCKPLKVGVVFSGGQAAGGHNVVIGLYDALKELNAQSQLFGFLDGPSGIIAGKNRELTRENLSPFRNQGGFDLLGSGRTKIETEEQLASALQVVQNMNLDGLVIIGGDDSNTNAAVLAEYFLQKKFSCKVIGVPKTIDGDLKNREVAISFGFDTACKTYAESIGNIARDALSSKKYYHFIRLMGRSASHIALECALLTQPNLTLIGEEVAQEKWTLSQVASQIADLICERAEANKNYGVILIPEGVIEFIPEIGALIKELNQALSLGDPAQVPSQLSPASQECFEALPEKIQQQLLHTRDPHGNVQVSKIETETLLIEMVEKDLERRGSYKGKFSPVGHFLGYEGRSGYPTRFDRHYCYALGFAAALLIDEGATGYMAFASNLTLPVEEWEIGGVSLTSLLRLEMRKGKEKPVIQKALVDLQGKAFAHFAKERTQWRMRDEYRYPGPIQFFGDPKLIDSVPATVLLEHS